eukprot:Rhum_TRINITY_DN21053_c0_g1::Rhum_TRINITY_DN21053_c0_g1_i1::g.173024::m.173024
MEKSLDALIVERGGRIEDDERPRGGGKKGGKGRQQGGGFAPYSFGKGGKKGGKGRVKGSVGSKGAGGQRIQPDVNDRWLHDRFKDETASNSRMFYKQPKEREAPDLLEHKVHIANFPWDWESGDIEGVLQTVAPVKRVAIYFDQAGRNSGAGMATFHSKAEADAVIEQLNGAKLGDREIALSAAKSSVAPGQRAKCLGFGQVVSKWRPAKAVVSEVNAAARPTGEVSQETLDKQLESFLRKGDDEAPAEAAAAPAAEAEAAPAETADISDAVDA